MIARLSEGEAKAIAFRYAEIKVAQKLRRRWLAQISLIADSSALNQKHYEIISGGSGWTSVAGEALEFLRIDQEQLDKEDLLARDHIAMCDRVIAELTGSLADLSLDSAYSVDGARDGSPLRQLQASPAAASRADKRLDKANDAWTSTLNGFAAEARSRHNFAGTSGSVTIDHLDALSADAFEEATAWLLHRDGCEVLRKRGGPNDQGADVIALTGGGLRVVLQCKHSIKPRSRVDPRYVRELNGTARQEHGADIVGIVTNRTLSDAAQGFATRQQIHVVDRPVLQRWATYGVSWIPF